MTACARPGLIALGLLATACAFDGDHLPDSALPDASPPLPTGECDDEQLRSAGFIINRCPDRAHLRIIARPAGPARVTLDGFGPVVHLDEAVRPSDWTVVVWSPRDGGLTVSYSGHARAPDVTLDLVPDGDCLLGTTALSFGRGDPLDAVDVWALGGPDAAFTGLGRWTTTPDGVQGWRDVERHGPAPRLLAQLGRAFVFGGLDPRRPLSTTVRDAGDGAGELRATLPGPLSGQGETWLSAPWAICAGASATLTLDAFGQRARLDAPPATAHLSTGITVDPDDPEALAAAGQRVAALGGAGHLWLRGDWAADRSAWTPRDAVAELAAALAPATVGVDWPALTLPPAAPLLIEHPDWLDADCADDCPRLDPRVPAVREHLARIRLALAEAGFEVRLTGVDHVPADDLRALLSALGAGRPSPTIVTGGPRAPSEQGLSPLVTLDPGPPARMARQMALWSRLGPFDAAAVEATADPDDGAIRQRLALAWVAGRGALPDADSADAADITEALTARWQDRPAAAAMRPLPGSWFDGADSPPPAPRAWRAADRLAIFNWSDAPIPWTDPLDLAPDLAGAANIFDPAAPALGDVGEVSIPPGDVVVWATVDGGPPGE